MGRSVQVIVITTSLEDHDASPLPVKNTFIHFEGAAGRNRSSVKRCITDPSSEPRLLPFLRSRAGVKDASSEEAGSPSDSDSEEAAIHSSSSTLSQASAEETCSTTDTLRDLPGSSSDWSSTSTPEASPRWVPSEAVGQPTFWVPVALVQDYSQQLCFPASTSNSNSTQELPHPALQEVHDDSTLLFNFTMRRTLGSTWGVEVKRDVINQALVVVSVLPEGAIEAWNRQVRGGPKADRALRNGDLLVGVNDESDCQGMVQELASSTMLTLKVLRMSAEAVETMANVYQSDPGWMF